MGILSLRGKQHRDIGNFKQMYELARSLENQENSECFRIKVVKFLHESCFSHQEEINQRGKRLKILSALLLLSTFFGVLSIVVFPL
jgi:hypothetical protein